MNIQWYPGHMTKTRRMIAEQIKNVDAVCEILDARIPLSSRNPDVDELTAGKPRLVVLNRVDQADAEASRRWAADFREKGYAVLETDAKSGSGTKQFAAAVRTLLADKLRAWAEKGQTGRVVRVMILGIPNVGKSTFINRVAGRKTAKTEDRPGVTRSKQWVPIDRGLELLDTPGILWPKFEDPEVGLKIAFLGSISEMTVNTEELACELLRFLSERDQLSGMKERTGLPEAPVSTLTEAGAVLEQLAVRRGCLKEGGVPDTEKAAGILLNEFRQGQLGRITLELPGEKENA